jgi:hypothetical protein
MKKPIEKKVNEGQRKDYSGLAFPKPVKKQRKKK